MQRHVYSHTCPDAATCLLTYLSRCSDMSTHRLVQRQRYVYSDLSRCSDMSTHRLVQMQRHVYSQTCPDAATCLLTDLSRCSDMSTHRLVQMQQHVYSQTCPEAATCLAQRLVSVNLHYKNTTKGVGLVQIRHHYHLIIFLQCLIRYVWWACFSTGWHSGTNYNPLLTNLFL
jgi:hypothetical protein